MSNVNMYIDDDLSSSWACIFENELANSIGVDIDAENKLEEVEDETIDINDILQTKCDTMCDIDILYYELVLIQHVKNGINNNTINMNITESCLRWVLTSSSYLMNKIGLTEYTHKVTDANIIPRSSYKFCFNNYECKYNYNPKCKGCYAQHYVHNMIYADTYALIEYVLKHNLTKLSEVRKSVNTMHFVIDHMHEELRNGTKYKIFSKNIHIDRTLKK